MPNHPNRGRASGPAANPPPESIRAAREAAGLTQTQAAALVYTTLSGWQRWEQGERGMHPGLWELFRIKVGGGYLEVIPMACWETPAREAASTQP
ncbi:MAG: helix-turn-helix transcriptional regulator [Rhodospirillales bacterium]|nr:helix-turn-helix transcriptional regulator [Rhodospirillales bacterium]